MPQTMKLLGSTKSNITKNKNGEMGFIGALLVHCNIDTMIINKIQDSCIHLFPVNCLVKHYIFHPKMLYI